MEKVFLTLLKNKEETYEKIIDLSSNNDYTTVIMQQCSSLLKNKKKQLLILHKIL